MSKSYNVNMNLPDAKPGRKAAVLSETDFKEILEAAYWKVFQNSNKFSISNFAYRFIIEALTRKSKMPSEFDDLKKDLRKVDIGIENSDIIGKIRFTDKKIPYILISAGGDWESSVLIAVYTDGKQIRAYIPEKGNAYNRDIMRALGNNIEADHTFIEKETDGKCTSASYITYNKEECIKQINLRLIPVEFHKHTLKESINKLGNIVYDVIGSVFNNPSPVFS